MGGQSLTQEWVGSEAPPPAAVRLLIGSTSGRPLSAGYSGISKQKARSSCGRFPGGQQMSRRQAAGEAGEAGAGTPRNPCELGTL